MADCPVSLPMIRNVALPFLACWLICLFSSTTDGQITPAEKFKLPAGFQAELVYEVPANQGSWVSMTTDPQGRLITCDQYGALYRVTLGDQTSIEKIDVQVGNAHGLLCAFDSLYVMSQGSGRRGNGPTFKSGLYKVQDTNGDDKYDQATLLREIVGRGEHGPHAIALGPDKKSLYVCGGNMTRLPEIAASRQAQVWQEDQVIHRFPDGQGHASNVMAPGGWICKTDPDGKSFEMVANGFRNEYDFAFDPNGEIFTYDSDMEWDVGLPWYRPTRVCHAVSGAEFGWRNGSGKWPEFYPDSVPPTVEIGPGSPTGVVFGMGAKFPAQYQNAFFISDWSYGVIYAIHLKPEGATYQGTKEVFCTAPALPVTDIVVNPQDGCMYFAIGGRRSKSALYRIRYKGDQPTVAVPYPPLTPAAVQRQALEKSHVGDGTAVSIETLVKALSSEDRAIRYAARIGLEKRPLEQLLAVVKKADTLSTSAQLELVTALARTGTKEHAGVANQVMSKMDFQKLSKYQKTHMLRNYGLLLCRMAGNPEVIASIQKLKSYFPSEDRFLNLELGKVLVAAQTPEVTGQLVGLLNAQGSQESQIGYALVLSVAKAGWTQPLRETYIQWFLDFANARGGNSFDKYLASIRRFAVSQLSAEEVAAMKPLLDKKPIAKDPYADLKARPFVKNWTLDELVPANENVFENRNLENGKKLFAVATCYKCHRINRDGGIVGPDLTAAGRRFNTRDLLETIIDPNKAISDQYEASIFLLVDGRTISGRVVNLSGDQYVIQPDMAEPNKLVRIKVGDIEETMASDVSPMPEGLLNHLTKDEILDLLAYMKSTATETTQ